MKQRHTVVQILAEGVHELKGRGAEAVISGCTEISVTLEEAVARGVALSLPVIDPMKILARVTVETLGSHMDSVGKARPKEEQLALSITLGGIDAFEEHSIAPLMCFT